MEPLSAPFTKAPAMAAHPAKPQPPQLAPGSNDCTSPIRWSSWTANFLAQTYSIKAATKAMAPSTMTANKMKFITFLCPFDILVFGLLLMRLQCFLNEEAEL
jgi:hypothetical protein